MKIKHLLLAGALSLAVVGHTGSAFAGCGYWAFGGAYKNYNSAVRQARKVNAGVYDLDDSNSPNAGKGYYVVAIGIGTKSDANGWKREFQQKGIKSYVANRCLYGNALNW